MRMLGKICLVSAALCFFGLAAVSNSHALCYDTWEIAHTCTNPNDQCTDWVEAHCVGGGCSGSFCATNYGTCCHVNYKYVYATGNCYPPPDYCGNSGAQNKRLIPRTRETYARARNSDAIPQGLVFVANQCSNSYTVVDPDAYFSGEGSPNLDDREKAEVFKR